MNDSNIPTPPRAAESLITTEISTSGRVTENEQQHAVESFSTAVADIGERILRCTIRLEHTTDPKHSRLATARLSVDLDGHPFHVHADAETVTAAVDLATHRIHERLRKHIDRRQDARRHGPSTFDPRLHQGDDERTASRPFPDPEHERPIERHTSLGPGESTIDEAIFDLESLGNDFHLFVEIESGDDVLVRRDDRRTDTYLVRFAGGRESTATETPIAANVEIDGRAAPHLGLVEARDLIDLGELSDVFFRDVESGRGGVLYRRDDGNLSLVTPPAMTP